jgi:hypothetical protein
VRETTVAKKRSAARSVFTDWIARHLAVSEPPSFACHVRKLTGVHWAKIFRAKLFGRSEPGGDLVIEYGRTL